MTAFLQAASTNRFHLFRKVEPFSSPQTARIVYHTQCRLVTIDLEQNNNPYSATFALFAPLREPYSKEKKHAKCLLPNHL